LIDCWHRTIFSQTTWSQVTVIPTEAKNPTKIAGATRLVKFFRYQSQKTI
jgi:hypothetical protein